MILADFVRLAHLDEAITNSNVLGEPTGDLPDRLCSYARALLRRCSCCTRPILPLV